MATKIWKAGELYTIAKDALREAMSDRYLTWKRMDNRQY